MLFDLRGRGRRRTVQAIYLGLALLFGIGFIGFGVGGVGGGGGGVIEGLFGSGNSGGETSYLGKIKKDRALTAAQPNNPNAWGALIHDTLLQASTGGNYNNQEETYTGKAKPLLNEAQQAWQRYLALNPDHPSSDLANLMFLKVFSGAGSLEDKPSAIQALQIVIAGRPPTVGLYEQLAILSYQTHNPHEGDLAAKKAIALAPAAEKAVLENQLAQIKQNPTGKEGTTAVPAGTKVKVPQTSVPKEFNPNATTTQPASGQPKTTKK